MTYQDIGYQVVQVMARRIRPDTPRPIVLGGLPAGAVVLSGVTQTIEPFENGGSFHVGTADKHDAYGSLSLGAKGRGTFADKAETRVLAKPTEVVISSPEEDKKEAPAPAQAKAEPANEKEAKARAARAAEAKAKKPEAEPEEAKPAKGEAVVYLTFIVVP